MTPRRVLAVAGAAILTMTPAVAAPARKQAKTLTVPAYTMPWLIDQAADYYRAQGIDVPAYRVTSARMRNLGEVDFNGPAPVIRYNPDEQSRAEDADTALHEVAHVIQGADRIYATTATVEWAEGQAAAVTADQLCPFMARTWGRAVAYAECRTVYPPYPAWTNTVRAYSARATGTAWMSPTARRYRLDQLRTLRRTEA